MALTRKEYELLTTLAGKAGETLSRSALFEHVWGYSFLGNTRTVDIHISRLRYKLASLPTTIPVISAERGVGYKLEAFGRCV
ncbi:winged helix-turn-helix domain-containing protein [Candidatus Gracilibacteria bacterium]|nr:winged helix-turn-helix domain-containing protein [Candidatus Gracilibacteria bacterium]